MTTIPATTARPLSIAWPTAVAMLAVGAILMFSLGAVVVPAGRFCLQVAYGIVNIAVLNPFGISLPPAAAFVAASVCLIAAALAAGRRVGGLLAFLSVERQLGSTNLAFAIAAVAGLVGAAGFIIATPWPAAPAGASPLYVAGNILLGYVLYVIILAAGPLRGTSLYLEAHPHCPACWVWLQRETGGGAFPAAEEPRLRAALAGGDFDALRALPIAAPSSSTDAFTLHWWSCPRCQDHAYLTCAPDDADRKASPIFVARLAGPRIRELRDTTYQRRALQDRARSSRTGS